MTQTTEQSIEAQVQQIFTNVGWPAGTPFLSVRECRQRGSIWSSRQPTGMFNIDIWSQRDQLNTRSRAHMFRTTKTGVVPVEKIKQFAIDRLEIKRLRAESEARREAAKKTNDQAQARLLLQAKETTGVYFSDFRSNSGSYISADSNVPGKVVIQLGSLQMTEDQASRLLKLVAEISPKK